jgi:Na+/proline symporter
VFATWFGAETCIGSAGKVYEGGLSAGNAEPFGYALALLLTGLIVAVPLWRSGITTVADLLRKRFSPLVETLAVLLFVPSAVMWAAAQIKAFGSILSVAGNVEVQVATAIATLIVIVYTVSGGLMADAVTDLIQGLTVIAGMLIILWFVVAEHGGLVAAWHSIDPAKLSLFPTDQPLLERLDAWAIPIFGSMVAPELISRVLATRSANVSRTSCLIAAAIYLLVGLIPVTVGLLAVKLQPDIAVADNVLPHIAETYLPPVLYVLFSGALVSAILSTVDTALLVAGSLCCHNLIFRFVPNLSELRKVRVTRIGVLIAGLVAYGLALRAGSVFELVLEASALGTAGMIVVVMFGLFTPFGRQAAALAALVSGTGLYFYATFLVGDDGIAGGRYTPAVLAALFAYVVVAAVEHLVWRLPLAHDRSSHPAVS